MRTTHGRYCECGNPATRLLNGYDVSCDRCWEIDNARARQERAAKSKKLATSPLNDRASRFVPTIYPFPVFK